MLNIFNSLPNLIESLLEKVESVSLGPENEKKKEARIKLIKQLKDATEPLNEILKKQSLPSDQMEVLGNLQKEIQKNINKKQDD